jgi:PhzF family phenazine biosynthesis protein
MKLPFVQIDAFADAPFSGNPAAVMPLEHWLDDATLQAIASENNLSETAFLVPDTSGTADYELRWFTPAREAALCGHATLASGHFLLSQGGERFTFATRRAGILSVERENDGYAMALPAYPPAPADVPGLMEALGLTSGDILSHPNGYLLVVVEDAAAVLALDPDFRALAALAGTLVIVTASGDETDIVSRVFAPAAGIDEDPVTGSAHCVLAPYWADRLGRTRFTAYQASTRGGHLDCEMAGDRVILRGRCVTVIEGSFTI